MKIPRNKLLKYLKEKKFKHVSDSCCDCPLSSGNVAGYFPNDVEYSLYKKLYCYNRLQIFYNSLNINKKTEILSCQKVVIKVNDLIKKINRQTLEVE